jgi:uncharacterized membrane protein
MTKNNKTEESGGFNPMYIIGAALVLVIAAFVIFGTGGDSPSTSDCGDDTCSVISKTAPAAEPAPVLDPDATYIPISDVDDGKAHFYEYNYNGKIIKYFILKSSDGIIRAAFDACDICYEAGKGYSQQGDYMVCNNCGQKFLSTKINEEKGGCNPAPLDRTVEDGEHKAVSLTSWTKDGYLAIKNSDIEAGAKYF